MSGMDTPSPRPGAAGDETRPLLPPEGPPDPAEETQSRRDPSSGPPGRFPFSLGPYEVVRELGRGGMGAVYQAVHTRLKKTVAVKVLPVARVHAPEAVARFYREMEALGALAHPNIVGATDAGEADGCHYLVMEYVDGVDLSTLVRLRGPLSVADAAEVIRQAACGLQYIHENGRVHRDVKPSNLMLSAAGEVKILDLGLALLRAEEGAAEAELTGSGDVMGTADYMAPEQWLDSHAVDIRADVYSLGCTLYKLLTGKAPFSGPSNGPPLSKRALHAQAPAPRVEARGDVPAPLQAALLRMLAKAPEDRFATPAEVAEAVRPFAAGCDLRRLVAEARSAAPRAGAPTPAPGARQAAPTRRRRRVGRWAALAAGLAVAAGLAAAVFLLWPSHPPAVKPLPLAWPSKGKNSTWQWFPESSELHVTCDGEGLIRFGEATGADYAFEVEVYQAPWGGAGVFFGHHAQQIDGKPCDAYQQVWVSQERLRDGRYAYFLKWKECRALAGGGGSGSEEAVAPIDEPGKGEQRLSISVEGGKLSRVLWNGADLLPKLRATPSAAPQLLPTGANCRGAWGAYTSHSTAVFYNPHPLTPGSP